MKELYKCDPNKNIKCSKENCIYNKNAIDPYCSNTTHKEFSIDDKTNDLERLTIFIPKFLIESYDIKKIREFIYESVEQALRNFSKEYPGVEKR